MQKLIEALNIFLKYKNLDFPTHCEHDALYVVGFEKDEISEEDVKKLEELNFSWSESDSTWYSYWYGSA